MAIKKVHKKLADFREKISGKTGKVSAEDKAELQKIINETLTISQGTLKKHAKKIDKLLLPVAENDNTPLTSEQKFRLRMMEQTGTGISTVH